MVCWSLCKGTVPSRRMVSVLEEVFRRNIAVVQAFVESFNGEQFKLGSRTFKITETIIARAIRLSATSESSYKIKTLLKADLNPYLKPDHENIDWTPTVHISYFRPEWQGVITTVQHYITCEGRLSTGHQYQIRFLSHISGSRPMNLPFFLYKYLFKMSQNIQ